MSDFKPNFDRLHSRRQFIKSALAGSASLLVPVSAFGAANKMQAVKTLEKAAPVAKEAVSASDKETASATTQLTTLQKQSPELGKIAQDAVDYAKYTIIAAAGGAAGSGNELGAAARAFVTSRKPKAKTAYAAKAKELLATPQLRQQFGQYASIEPAKFMSVGHASLAQEVGFTFQKNALAAGLKTLSLSNDDRLDLKTDAPKGGDSGKPDSGKPDSGKKEKGAKKDPGLEYKNVEFRLTRVHCLESTGGVFEGDDELLIGGLVVGAQGATEKVKQWSVGEFGDGTAHDWSGEGYLFHKFNLITGKGWPTHYSAMVAMADQDDGGFGEFLEALWSKVASYVTAAIGAAGGTAIGSALGSVIPGLGTLIGAIVGAVIGWLISLFHNDDDIIGTRTATLSLADDTLSYYDWAKLTSSEGLKGTLTFSEDGYYRLAYSWHVAKS